MGIGIGLLMRGVTFPFLQTNTIQGSQLSQRAKEFIAMKKEIGDTMWKTVNPNSGGKILGAQKITADSCFSISIPVAVRDIKKTAPCFLEITLSTPMARIVVYEKESPTPIFDEISGVQLRRSEPQEYFEAKENNNQRTYITFKKNHQSTTAEYEKTAFLLQDTRLFVLTLSAPTNQNLDPLFHSILSSIDYTIHQ